MASLRCPAPLSRLGMERARGARVSQATGGRARPVPPPPGGDLDRAPHRWPGPRPAHACGAASGGVSSPSSGRPWTTRRIHLGNSFSQVQNQRFYQKCCCEQEKCQGRRRRTQAASVPFPRAGGLGGTVPVPVGVPGAPRRARRGDARPVGATAQGRRKVLGLQGGQLGGHAGTERGPGRRSGRAQRRGPRTASPEAPCRRQARGLCTGRPTSALWGGPVTPLLCQ